MNNSIKFLVMIGMLAFSVFGFTAACANNAPHTIAFSIDYPGDLRPFMNVDVNGEDYVTFRPKGLNDIVDYPAKSATDPNMYVQIDWYDTYTDRYFRTKTMKIEPSKLAQFDINEPGYVSLTIWLGRNGMVRVQTEQQERFNLLNENRFEEITNVLREPVVFDQFCAESYQPSDEERKMYGEMKDQLSKSIAEGFAFAQTQPKSETICE